MARLKPVIVALSLGTLFSVTGILWIALKIRTLERDLLAKNTSRSAPAKLNNVDDRIASLEADVQRLGKRSVPSLTNPPGSSTSIPPLSAEKPVPGDIPLPILRSQIEAALQEHKRQEQAAQQEARRQEVSRMATRLVARWLDRLTERLGLTPQQRDVLAKLLESEAAARADEAGAEIFDMPWRRWDFSEETVQAIRRELTGDQSQKLDAFLAEARPRMLGVSNAEALSPQEAQTLGLLADQGGLKISDISPGSAAQRAGLQNGDIVIGVGGENLPPNNPRRSLREILQGITPNTVIPLTVIRNGQRLTVTTIWNR